MQQEESSDILRVKTLAVAASVAGLLLAMVWVAFPLLNLSYVQDVLDKRYGLGWWAVVPLALNAILPLLLLSSVAKTQSVVRADIHLLATWASLVLNLISSAGLILIGLIYVNTLYSAYSPFNDYQWCCVFATDRPDLCPLVGSCSLGGDLHVNAEYWAMLGFAIVFLILSLVHAGVNRMLRTSGTVPDYSLEKPEEGRQLALVYVVVIVGLIIYWAGVPFLNTVHVHGYPRFPIPPMPNTFESLRYTFQYWVLAVLVLHILPIYFFVFAMIFNKTRFSAALHYWSAIIMAIVGFLIVCVLLFIWLAGCNWPYAGGSICSDYQWCCTYFHNAPHLCANVTPCSVEPSLWANSEYIQHVIFAVVFALGQTVGIWLNTRMKHYRVFL